MNKLPQVVSPDKRPNLGLANQSLVPEKRGKKITSKIRHKEDLSLLVKYALAVLTLHHSKSSPLADEKAMPEYEYRSTMRVVPDFSFFSINDLQT